MTWRIVHIKESERLQLKLDNLEILKRGEKYLIPLSDISMVVIEGNTSITTNILSQFTKYNIVLVVCDNKYLPTGLLLNYGNYHHCAKRVIEQVHWLEEKKRLLWKDIVGQKILNQIEFAKYKGINEERLSIMIELYNQLQPGDYSNREGHVAKVYFNSLYGVDFSRDNDCMVNGAMNYGYAILRAAMARIVVGQGLMTMLGIFHKNEYNSFNLVDDLMEPFRPIMDYWIDQNILSEYEFLTYEARLTIIDFLNQPMIYLSKKSSVDQVMQKYVSSFLKAISGERNKAHPVSLMDFMGAER
ncbi:CRISPR-associated endonuclease Cas1 [Enterococcus florum]|uniref:CRISPR-associated endonuclease Cas1 n=1 Tax=Enterococcus florum TaxID=2480627 RepID=A0A4P5PEL4_9ENTE|nr:type II CRISPR-associated endonuclease Cas1 [Enterococcus florum]GCF95094.1 CRISPR-associated endonuclease Cas1 [Enterococcus florum]